MENEVKFYESGPKLEKEKIYAEKPRWSIKFARFLMNYSYNLIKTETQAYYIILAIAGIIIIITFILFFSVFSGPNKPLYKEDIMESEGLS